MPRTVLAQVKRRVTPRIDTNGHQKRGKDICPRITRINPNDFIFRNSFSSTNVIRSTLASLLTEFLFDPCHPRDPQFSFAKAFVFIRVHR
ncbi:MAG: hypothetical protein DME91_00320 [Verrucomicrobia bacterium]|nr:MAG: hypothetical protein DME91_00320 [Verrucomicrobiota bacterium]